MTDLDLPRVALKKVTPQVSAAMGALHAAAVAVVIGELTSVDDC